MIFLHHWLHLVHRAVGEGAEIKPTAEKGKDKVHMRLDRLD